MKWPIAWLVPRIRLADLPVMIALATTGAFLAGLYGILHDLVIFTISPEYFTKMKFDQFQYADLGLGDPFFAGTIGFLASWWVGAAIAWFLARRLVPGRPRLLAYRMVLRGFFGVLVITAIGGAFGYLLGIARGPNADYSNWYPIAQTLGVQDVGAFVRVAYIHSGSYLGALAGFGVAIVLIRHKSVSADLCLVTTKDAQK